MAPNPNPVRISAPMWDWIEYCCSLTTTPTPQEQAGVWVRQPGSHSDAIWLRDNRPNDYSLRGAKQAIYDHRGTYGRAWDWGFPSAWSGDWREIGIYSTRIQAAWQHGDPRTYPLFEVLCQTPEDREPEGFVFYPEKRFRVPDRSHETHMHNGILTAYIDDWIAFADLKSLYGGEPLALWQFKKEVKEGREMLGFACSFDGDPKKAIYVSNLQTYSHYKSWPMYQELVARGVILVNPETNKPYQFGSLTLMEQAAGRFVEA